MKLRQTILPIMLLGIFLVNQNAYAVDISSDNDYQLQINKADPFNEPTVSYPNPSIDIKVTNPGDEISQSGNQPQVVTGFSSLRSRQPFTISLSAITIPFGKLSASDPVIRSDTLGIDSESGYGYSIFAFEDNKLSSGNKKIFIPDTSCDNGQCKPTESGVWTSNLTYGFGIGFSNQFSSQDYYRPLTDNSQEDSLPSLISDFQADKIQSQLFFKVNIAATQKSGTYSNNIYLIAAPRY